MNCEARNDGTHLQNYIIYLGSGHPRVFLAHTARENKYVANSCTIDNRDTAMRLFNAKVRQIYKLKDENSQTPTQPVGSVCVSLIPSEIVPFSLFVFVLLSTPSAVSILTKIFVMLPRTSYYLADSM